MADIVRISVAFPDPVIRKVAIAVDQAVAAEAAARAAADADLQDQIDALPGGGGGSMTGAEILAALLPVDGAGSGLDADRLAGQSSTYYATAAALAGKANTTHTHSISDTTGLQAALDAKANTSHTHTLANIVDAGTMSAQDANNVAITGGTISGVNFTNATFLNVISVGIPESVAGEVALSDDASINTLTLAPASGLTANRRVTFEDRDITVAGIDSPIFQGTPIAPTPASNDNSTRLATTAFVNAFAGSSNITTLGTITAGTWSGTTIAVNKGGTGQTTYTDGQILVGNSTGNTLTKTTLTAGAGITITNGPGSITIAATGGAGAGNPRASLWK